MTPLEFYQMLAESDVVKGTLTVAPGPFNVKFGKQDVMAARLILWLTEQLPDNTTQGDFENILDAAKWWSTFWATVC